MQQRHRADTDSASRGKNGLYPVTQGDLPVQVIVALGDAADAAAGMCGESSSLLARAEPRVVRSEPEARSRWRNR